VTSRASLPTLPDTRPSQDEAALALASEAVLAAVRAVGGIFPRGQLEARTVAELEAVEVALLGAIQRIGMAGRGGR